MAIPGKYRVDPTKSLSARLLVLTVIFVMLAEILIWTPSVARFRETYLKDFVARAYLSMLALDAMPETQPNADLENKLLFHTQALAIILNRTDRRLLMVGGDMPPEVDFTVNLVDGGYMRLVVDAFGTMLRDDNRVLRVIGMPPTDADVTVEVLLYEGPLRAAMLEFSWRIFTLSIAISLFTASLVYFSLQWLMVRPMRRLTRSMKWFRDNPEDERRVIQASSRADEIGEAQRELAEMQAQVRTALRQKDRLAALGAAVAKINHDLRNSLATAVLASDRLQSVEDPEVKRVMPRLMKAIDRAVELCSQTLNYSSEQELELRPEKFQFRDLVDEVVIGMETTTDVGHMNWNIEIDATLQVNGDRRHLFRALHNLGANAVQAGAKTLTVSAANDGGAAIIRVIDDGPGMPNRAREKLFQPFAGSARKDGTGLGLVIVRDIVRAHGGDIVLETTSDSGTVFKITLPAA